MDHELTGTLAGQLTGTPQTGSGGLGSAGGIEEDPLGLGRRIECVFFFSSLHIDFVLSFLYSGLDPFFRNSKFE